MTTSTEHFDALAAAIDAYDLHKHSTERDDCYRCVGCERLVTPTNRICSACDPLAADASDAEVDRLLHISEPTATRPTSTPVRATGRPV